MFTHINFHFSVKAVIEQQIVGHSYPVRLHRMPLAIIVVPNIA